MQQINLNITVTLAEAACLFVAIYVSTLMYSGRLGLNPRTESIYMQLGL